MVIADEDIARAITQVRLLLGISQSELSQLVGASLVSIARWERGDSQPSHDTAKKIKTLYLNAQAGQKPDHNQVIKTHMFASRGARFNSKELPLFEKADRHAITLSKDLQDPLIDRLKPSSFWGNGQVVLNDFLFDHSSGSVTLESPSTGSVSAGKNTYTYDAHTYHTKVPPQGIAEVIKEYLPKGGLILDPFSGSGMTGVATQVLGYDVILNELSPAASFISDRFVRRIDPDKFAAGLKAIQETTLSLRKKLYATHCRECGKSTELQYTVWSYNVICPKCSNEFTLWDHCRSYGKTVREHKILSEFPCPCCKENLKKSRLARTTVVPVVVGYKCCNKIQIEHAPSETDLENLRSIEQNPPLADSHYPRVPLPDGMNLCQPKRHGLSSIEKLYTTRNLCAMSNIWRAIHQIEDAELAGYLGFVFTSLYQRVTRLSEFRFWGGSGNTAHFNVPYIFNEANVFATFDRKSRTIQDHLQTTAQNYRGRAVVHTGSATNLNFIPDNSIDLIFTDPPFGGNIHYSEMNIIWESWLNNFTDNRYEAIVNKFQGKDEKVYGDLMTLSLSECYRVLRPGHWLLLVFMNSSKGIWEQLQRAIVGAGFSLERMDVFDKQHGTFKQFVSENTAGSDLILHCRKELKATERSTSQPAVENANTINEFLHQRREHLPILPYFHVTRESEIDYRTLYSEWLATGLLNKGTICDFGSFRAIAKSYLSKVS